MNLLSTKHVEQVEEIEDNGTVLGPKLLLLKKWTITQTRSLLFKSQPNIQSAFRDGIKLIIIQHEKVQPGMFCKQRLMNSVLETQVNIDNKELPGSYHGSYYFSTRNNAGTNCMLIHSHNEHGTVSAMCTTTGELTTDFPYEPAEIEQAMRASLYILPQHVVQQINVFIEERDLPNSYQSINNILGLIYMKYPKLKDSIRSFGEAVYNKLESIVRIHHHKLGQVIVFPGDADHLCHPKNTTYKEPAHLFSDFWMKVEEAQQLT